MNTRAFIFFIFLAFNSFGQSWNWANDYGTGGYNDLHSIQMTDSGLLISGIIEDTTIFGNDTLHTNGISTLGYLAKIDFNGNPIWAKSIFTNNGTFQNPTFPVHISVDEENTIYLSSQFTRTIILGNDTINDSGGELFVSKLDQNGNFKWTKNFGDNNPSGTNVVELGRNSADAFGNIYLVGTFNDTAYFQTDTLYRQEGQIFIAKYDKNGLEKWVRQCGKKTGGWQRGYDVTTDHFGNIYLTGAISSGNSFFGSAILYTPKNRSNAYITKLDSLGNFLWAIDAGSTNDNQGGGQINPNTYGVAIKTDNNENVYLTGFFSDSVEFGTTKYYPNCGNSYCLNFFLADFDANGDFKWLVQSPAGAIYSAGQDVEVDVEGNIYVAGTFKSQISFNSFSVASSDIGNHGDLFIAKFDTLGKCLGLLNSDTHTSRVDMTLDCLHQSIFVGSDFNGSSGNLASLGIPNIQNQNIFLAEISNSIDCNFVSTNESDHHGSNILAYPNPFSDELSIDLTEFDYLSDFIIVITNILGENLFSKKTTEKRISINGSDMPDGIYFIHLYDQKGTHIGKVKKVIHQE